MTDICPACKKDLRAEEIPEKDRYHYMPGTTHYSNLISVYSVEGDRTVGWRCPFCAFQHKSRSAFRPGEAK